MRKSIVLLLFALLAGAAGQVQASAQTSVQAAGSSAASTRASASVSFRIVIRESLSLGGQQQKSRPNGPPLTRTVSFEGGREVVTLARP